MAYGIRMHGRLEVCHAVRKTTHQKAEIMSRRNLAAVAEALGLPEGYVVTKYAKGDACDRAWVERKEISSRACPRCGAKGHVNGHYRSRVWHTPTRGGTQLCLLLHQVRLRCPECGKCWSQKHEELLSDVSSHMTARVADNIEWDLKFRKSVRECSLIWGPSRHLVNKVVGRVFVGWQYMPTTLCIDEFKADTDAGRMAIGIYDGDWRRIIEVLPDMRRETLDWFFDGFTAEERSKVRFFTCDMSSEMVAVQKRWFPQAKLCIDRFHVIKLANKSLSDVRKRIQADVTIPEELRKEPKGSWKLLVMGRNRLKAIDDDYAMEMAEKRAKYEQFFRVDEDGLNDFPRLRVREPLATKLERLLSLSDELRVAYELAQSLRLIHQLGKKRWWDGMGDELAKWRSYARQSKIPEFVACAKTLKKYHEGILNSYRYDRTNAVAEGINNSIKVIKRRGYGIRLFEAFRRRVLLGLGLGNVEVLRLSIRDIETD